MLSSLWKILNPGWSYLARELRAVRTMSNAGKTLLDSSALKHNEAGYIETFISQCEEQGENLSEINRTQEPWVKNKWFPYIRLHRQLLNQRLDLINIWTLCIQKLRWTINLGHPMAANNKGRTYFKPVQNSLRPFCNIKQRLASTCKRSAGGRLNQTGSSV